LEDGKPTLEGFPARHCIQGDSLQVVVVAGG
jgi:hypothetical protein